MRKLLAVFLIAFATPVLAAPAKPSEVASVSHRDTPYGYGTYRALMMKIYDASLWTDAKNWSMQVPFALTLHYRMDFSAEEIIDRSIEEMNNIAPIGENESHYRDILQQSIHDVKDGDRITAISKPGGKLTFYYNGTPTHQVTDAKFASDFIGIWLNARTSDPSLRAKLLPTTVAESDPQ